MRDIGLRPRRPCAVRRKAGWLSGGAGPAPDARTEGLAASLPSPTCVYCLLPRGKRVAFIYRARAQAQAGQATQNPSQLSQEQLSPPLNSWRMTTHPVSQQGERLFGSPGPQTTVFPSHHQRQEHRQGTQSNLSACSQLPLHSPGFQVTRGCRVGDR